MQLKTKRSSDKKNILFSHTLVMLSLKKALIARNHKPISFRVFCYISFRSVSFRFISFSFYFVSYFTGTLVRPCSFSICLSLFNLLLILYVSCFVSYNRHWFVLIFTVSYLFLFFITGLHSEGGLSADVTPSHFMCLSQVKRYFKKSLR